MCLISLYYVYKASRSCLLCFLCHPYIPHYNLKNFLFTCTYIHAALKVHIIQSTCILAFCTIPIFLIPRIFYLLVSPSFLPAVSMFFKTCNGLYISVTLHHMIMDVFRYKVCLSHGGLYATACVRT